MGLYQLETGAGGRASDVVYDREGSSFSRLSERDLDWCVLLADADRLHPLADIAAQGARCAHWTIRLAEILKLFIQRTFIGFEGWKRRGAVSPVGMTGLVGHADKVTYTAAHICQWRDFKKLFHSRSDDQQRGQWVWHAGLRDRKVEQLHDPCSMNRSAATMRSRLRTWQDLADMDIPWVTEARTRRCHALARRIRRSRP